MRRLLKKLHRHAKYFGHQRFGVRLPQKPWGYDWRASSLEE
jgi:hypothetical protein